LLSSHRYVCVSPTEKQKEKKEKRLSLIALMELLYCIHLEYTRPLLLQNVYALIHTILLKLWDKNTSSSTSVFKDNMSVKSVIFVVSCHMGGHKSAKSAQKLIFSSLRTGNIYLNNILLMV